jgi:hypothetical protein
MDDGSYSTFVVFDGQPITRNMATAARTQPRRRQEPGGGERRLGRIMAPAADEAEPARRRKTPQRP